ncbi:glycosyltransferase family 2 protein [Halorubrum sp. F4]|uniref:glycosyltransferase family 2 protein n=1 Tax=Halorubrum sp. F4 TaxID=2989715 RepID=UPI0024805BB9|nr:glycosyltransferase family 2 protein [Halorubrum sp. F4]
MPIVSVVIPTYNRSETISTAIDSVLDQNFQDFNIIVVDDGSKDRTQSVVSQYTEVDLYSFNRNRGQAAARQKGVKEAEGEYISFLDSDDELCPNHLSKAVEYLNETDSNCVGAFTAFKYADSGRISHVPDNKITFDDVRSGHIIGGYSQHTYRSDVFNHIKITRDIGAATGYDLSLRLLKKGYSMIGINEPLVRKYNSENSISSDPERLINGHKKIIELHGKDLTNKAIAQLYYSEAHALVNDKKIDQANRKFKDSLVTYPWNPRYLLYYLASAMGYRAFQSIQRLKEVVWDNIRTYNV